MAFAAVASKRRAPLAVAGLLKGHLLAAPSASGAASSVAAAALRPPSVVASRRLFSAGGAPSRGDDLDGEEERSGNEGFAYGRSRSFSLPFSPVTADIFREPVCMGRMFKAAAALTGDEAAPCGCCGCWVMTEDVDKVKLKVAMPGLRKKHVKVWWEQDDLVMEAERDRDTEFDDDDEDPPRYMYRMTFPAAADYLKMDQIKAEMKNGQLKVIVPKIKFEEEPADVFQVKIEREEESSGLYGTSRSPGFVFRPASGVAARRDDLDGEDKCSGDEDVASDCLRLRSRGFSLPLTPVAVNILRKVAVGEAATRGCCGFWVLTEDVDAVKLKVAMPGLGKDDVEVWAEQDDLVIEAEGDRDPEFDEEEEDPARYRYRMEFTKRKDDLKMDQIKAEMKDGVLKLTVPKIKREEEPTDVFQVWIMREESMGLYGVSRRPGFVVVAVR